MKIICDTAQQKDKHDVKHRQLEDMGYELITIPLPVADYVLVDAKVQDVIDRKAKRNLPVKKMDLLGAYKVAVDTKKDIQEIIGNICGKQHERFRDELILAQNNGVKLFILIEDDGGCVCKSKAIYNNPVRKVEDLFHWVNPRLFILKNGKRCFPNATKGAVLAKAMITMEHEYGCKFLFCSAMDTGNQIARILKCKE